MSNLDDVQNMAEFGGGRTRSGKVTLLPDPEPRERFFPIISVDDHIVEPPDMFQGRFPARLQKEAPKVVEMEDGAQLWEFDGNRYPNVGFNAVVGRPLDEYSMEPARFDEMRRGCWDIHERVRDMDLNGIAASLNFPSLLPGFAGTKFADATDPEVGLAAVRAWNDWHLEEWAGPYPDRIIPCQVAWLNDPQIAAEEIVRNAERGFKAVSFCELPEKIGRPSLHTGHWDPFLRACEETGTVICLHVGSSATTITSATDAPMETIPALFPVNSMIATVDWLFSKIPLRFPEIRIMMSEGGIGWVPSLMDRIDHNFRYHGYTSGWSMTGDESQLLPSEVLRRNFWFCAIEDPSGFRLRDRTGVSQITVESDYPHADSTWPDTQKVLADQFVGIPREEVLDMTYRNAERLFRHRLPDYLTATGEPAS